MKNNLRFDFYNGTLQMDEDLLQKFMELGILVPQKERIRTSDQEKFDFMISLYEQHHGSIDELKDDPTKMRNGMTFKDARRWIIFIYKYGELKLNDEQIKSLKEKGLLNDSAQEKNEKEELAKKYGLSIEAMSYAQRNYPSIEAYIEAIKMGKDSVKGKVSFAGPKVITVTSKEMTEEQKQRYVAMITDLLNLNLDKWDYKEKFIDIDLLEEWLQSLHNDFEKILRMKYGIGEECKNNKEIGEILGKSKQYIPYIIHRITRFGRIRRALNNVVFSENDYDNYIADCERDISQCNEQIEDIKRLKEIAFDEKGKLRTDFSKKKLKKNGVKNSPIINLLLESINQNENEDLEKEESSPDIESLDFSVKTYSCLKRWGINFLKDFDSMECDALKNIRNLGIKQIPEIERVLTEHGFTIIEDADGISRFKLKIDENGTKDEQVSPEQVSPEQAFLNKCDEEFQKIMIKKEELEAKKIGLKKQKEVFEKAVDAFLHNENIFDASATVPKLSLREIAILRIRRQDDYKKYIDLFNDDIDSSKKVDELLGKRESRDMIEDISIKDLDLPMPIFNYLIAHGIIQIKDIISKTPQEIEAALYFKGYYSNLINKLSEIGIKVVVDEYGTEKFQTYSNNEDNSNEKLPNNSSQNKGESEKPNDSNTNHGESETPNDSNQNNGESETPIDSNQNNGESETPDDSNPNNGESGTPNGFNPNNTEADTRERRIELIKSIREHQALLNSMIAELEKLVALDTTQDSLRR